MSKISNKPTPVTCWLPVAKPNSALQPELWVEVSNVAIVIRTFGIGLKQIVISPKGNTVLLIHSSVTEPYLKRAAIVVVGNLRQRRGQHHHWIDNLHGSGNGGWHVVCGLLVSQYKSRGCAAKPNSRHSLR